MYIYIHTHNHVNLLVDEKEEQVGYIYTPIYMHICVIICFLQLVRVGKESR